MIYYTGVARRTRGGAGPAVTEQPAAERDPGALDALSEVLLFELEGQLYALPSPSVLEVVRAVSVRPLPKAPPIVEGVIDLRGSLVPVLDIRSRFELAHKPLAHTDHFVIARAGDRRVALRVDRALDLAHIQRGQLEDVQHAVPGVCYVSGVAKLPEGLALIHDLQTFLTPGEASQLEAAVAPAAARGTR